MDQFELELLDVERQLDLDKLIISNLASHTLMMYHANDYYKEGIASALLINYLDQDYLISVGHTFLDYEKEIKNMAISLVDIPLSTLNGIIYKPSKVIDYYEMDYAIFLLTKEISIKIREKFSFLKLNEEVKKYQFHSIWNFIFGYPSTRNKVKSFSNFNKLSYCCIRLPLYWETKIISKYNNERNICLFFEKDNVVKTEKLATSESITTPKLNGISGCGIWSVPAYPFAFDGYSLQGMVIGHNVADGILIGFTVQDIIEMVELTKEKYLKEKWSGIVFSI